MANIQTEHALLELDERLLQLTRAQAKLTWALRGIRLDRAQAVAAGPGPAPVGSPVSPASTAPGPNMLRVAPPMAVLRPTKRNYDYFADLQQALSALPAE